MPHGRRSALCSVRRAMNSSGKRRRKKPLYVNHELSPYPHLSHVGRDEQEDPFHFAPSLIKLIASSPHQEVATHTFSHYYCLEKGQDIESFRADLEAAKKVASKYTLNMESLVFPRNQFNGDYLSACKELGIKAYRGNERSWIYRAKSREDESLFRRAVRLLDAYVNISGHNCYALERLPRDSTSKCSVKPISSACFHQSSVAGAFAYAPDPVRSDACGKEGIGVSPVVASA